MGIAYSLYMTHRHLEAIKEALKTVATFIFGK
jgi:hypothetical protein